ncbi:hypothetical protein [Rubrivirga sp.]|uniref:hypothetical protein n=1 Tax=Rubrivirga sp. TaxID=1885344 RepID=UPI003B51A103
MGQQQLLLLVLGIVIVGLAVVVGIQAFGENQKKANTDAVVNDAIRIASDAQAWALKPTAFGGGNGNFCAGETTTAVTLTDLGYKADYENANGEYSIAVTDCTSMEITGTGDASTVTVAVAGTDSDDITTSIAAIEADED